MKVFPVNSLIKELGSDGLPVYDRPYESQDLRNVNKAFFTDGVFSKNSDELQVFPASSGGMNIEVHPGQCLIQGAFGIETEKRTLQLQAAEIDNDRIDTVVARLNLSVEHRNIDLYILKGTPALSPERPELTRNATVWEIGLADMYIPKQTTNISQVRISDTRLEKVRCGFVAPFVELDTTTFYDDMQRQTDIAVQLAKDALDQTTAGKLQSDIAALNSKFPVSIENGGTGVTTEDGLWSLSHKKPKLIFRGNAKGGDTISIPELGKYNVISVVLDNEEVTLPLVRCVRPTRNTAFYGIAQSSSAINLFYPIVALYLQTETTVKVEDRLGYYYFDPNNFNFKGFNKRNIIEIYGVA